MKITFGKCLTASLMALAIGGTAACTSPDEKNTNNSNIMTYDEIVHNRYSCKSFNSERQVEAAALDAILEAGRVAPTAKNLQEQRIYVINDAELLRQIDSVSPCRYGAPTVVVVAYDTTQVYTYPDSQRTSGVEDATIVATHMILAATANGVNSCWVNCFNPDKMERLLNLPANEKVVMMMDLGYATPDAGPLANHSSRKPLEATVTFGAHK